MKAGKLRFRLLIQNPHPTSSSTGYATNWTDHGEIWANIEGLSSRERSYAAQYGSLATHKITTRFTDSIGNRSRLILGAGPVGSGTLLDRVTTTSRVFAVESTVDPDGRQHELNLTCVEKIT